jgi:hypothetical protein
VLSDVFDEVFAATHLKKLIVISEALEGILDGEKKSIANDAFETA